MRRCPCGPSAQIAGGYLDCRSAVIGTSAYRANVDEICSTRVLLFVLAVIHNAVYRAMVTCSRLLPNLTEAHWSQRRLGFSPVTKA
jgi:hypothetical protein